MNSSEGRDTHRGIQSGCFTKNVANETITPRDKRAKQVPRFFAVGGLLLVGHGGQIGPGERKRRRGSRGHKRTISTGSIRGIGGEFELFCQGDGVIRRGEGNTGKQTRMVCG